MITVFNFDFSFMLMTGDAKVSQKFSLIFSRNTFSMSSIGSFSRGDSSWVVVISVEGSTVGGNEACDEDISGDASASFGLLPEAMVTSTPPNSSDRLEE